MITLSDLRERAELVCAGVRPGEVVEVHAAATTREAVRWDRPGTVVPQDASLSVLVRVEVGSRDAHLVLSGSGLADAGDAVRLLRDLAQRHGRPVPPGRHAHAEPSWDRATRYDEWPADPEVLAGLRDRFGEQAELCGARAGSGAVVVEQHRAVFASSRRETRAFELSVVEGRCFVEVPGPGDTPARATALTHAHRSDRLVPVAAVAEAAQDAAARAAGQVVGPPPAQVLLAPRKAAQLVAIATRDVVTARRTDLGPVPELVDDGLATGAPHARPFDVEGTPTGRTLLVGREGRVTLPHARGTASSEDLLGGHAARQEYDTAPQAWPRNVLLAACPDGPTAVVDEAAPRQDHPFCHGVTGGDVMHLRTADTLMLGLDLAARTDAGDVVRHGRVRVTATAGELLGSLTPLTGPCAFVRGREFSTGSGWALLDLTRLRCEPDEGAQ